MEKNIIKTSVRNLIEFVLASGDLNYAFSGNMRNIEAIKVHQKLQKYCDGKNYLKEVPVAKIIEREGIILEVNGRIDRLIIEECNIIIDEIKTTTSDLEFITEDYNMLHWAQLKVYGYIYASEKSMDSINLQLTYSDLDARKIKKFIKEYTLNELKEFFEFLIDEYMKWALNSFNWSNIRNESIDALKFPFRNYRKGQRDFVKAVYITIRDRKKLFIQAPTGIGKTVGAIFPTIKALQNGFTSKIFYLTAKTITRTAAEKAFNMLRTNGLKIKTVTITAKEKVCINEKFECDPAVCEFAKGYYDKINSALSDIINLENFSRETIEKYAKKHKVCPFEFSLDISNFADCIICDYNYVFDPRVYLKRFFTDIKGEYTFLIDEAHNLVDRAREMFSAEIHKREIMDLKKKVKNNFKDIYDEINQINAYMIEIRKSLKAMGQVNLVSKEELKELYPFLKEFIKIIDKYLLNKAINLDEDLMNLYFNILNFLKIAENYDEKYVTYIEDSREDLKIKIFCLDPSKLLKKIMDKGVASIIFSATLSPMDYFQQVLGADIEDSYKLRLNSPFNPNNLSVIVNDNISTKYNDRERSYSSIVKIIIKTFENRNGNYMIFFPSYEYMRNVVEEVQKVEGEFEIVVQENTMSEEDREKFLENFKEDNKKTLLGFVVMGGIFGEGIDLVGDKLIGVIIVGVCLPKICFERNIIKNYFNEVYSKGFEYSYIYPGINRVMQAGGRVIRAEEDKGIIVLIDERFSEITYSRLLPYEWNHKVIINNLDVYEKHLKCFWGNKTF